MLVPSMYIPLAIQSPDPSTHCGPQCAQMPNFASRNHCGVSYFRSDSHVGSKSPFCICSQSSDTGTLYSCAHTADTVAAAINNVLILIGYIVAKIDMPGPPQTSLIISLHLVVGLGLLKSCFIALAKTSALPMPSCLVYCWAPSTMVSLP